MAFFPHKAHRIALIIAAVVASSSLTISARKIESSSSLYARLKVAEEGPSSCWEALSELQSCSGEVVMFFLNGETQLGAHCCSAITVIEHQCWPSMLGTLGITTEESNVLRGYCDATASANDDGGVAAAPPAASSLEKCYNIPRLQH